MIKSIKFGFARLWKGHGLVLHYYLANLVFGGLIMLPWWFALKEYAGHSLVGQRPGGLGNLSFLTEFLITNPGIRAIMLPLIGVSLAAFLLFSLFLSGGALASFTTERGFQARVFWGDSGYLFPRFIRLFLWSLPLLLVPICLFGLYDMAMEQWDPYENIVYWLGWAAKLAVLLFFFTYVRILDYGRIHSILNDERNMRRCLMRGFSFVRKRCLRALSLPGLFLLAASASTFLYLAGTQKPAFPWLDDAFLLLLAGQVHIIFRLCFKLTTYGAELHFYETFNPRPVAENPAERLWMSGPAILDKTLARGADDLVEEHDTEPEPVPAFPKSRNQPTEIISEPESENLEETAHDSQADHEVSAAAETKTTLPDDDAQTQIMPAPPGQTQIYDPASDIIDLDDGDEPQRSR